MVCAACRREGVAPVAAAQMPPPSTAPIVDVDAYDICQRQLRLISRSQDLLEAMQDDPAIAASEVAKAVNALTRSMGSVVKEARAFEQMRSEQADQLTHEERRAVFSQWFESLPPEQARDLYAEMGRRVKG
jgi:hypothetical protein